MATLTRDPALGSGAVQETADCAFCGYPIAPGELVRCPACQATYHAQCWSFNGDRCARLGCNGQVEPEEWDGTTDLSLPAPRLRLEEAEIAAAVPQRSPLQRDDLIAGVWATPQLAALTGGLYGLLADLLFKLTAMALRWEMGDPRFQQMRTLHALATCNRASWWLWLLGGAAYGILHRGYLAGRVRTLYPPLRALLAATLLGSLSLALGHAMFPLTYHWPGILWGVPASLAWMPECFSWGLLAATLARAVAGYTKPASLFAMLCETWMLAFAMTLDGNATACLQGMIGHYLGWLAGGAASLLWPGHHLAARAAATVASWSARIGFLAGCAEVVFPSKARRRDS